MLPWGFRIDPDDPLRFKDTVVDGTSLRVDLFLATFWNEEPAERPAILNVVMRIWCLSPPLYFRPEWDAPELANQIDPATGRVMLRLHFDLANEDQPGPRNHLQLGGVQHGSEWHWFPETLSVPRLLHMPVDLVLATEMIAATFYPEDYLDIRREPSWTHARRTSERHLLPDYLTRAMDAVNNGGSVLEALWNISWP